MKALRFALAVLVLVAVTAVAYVAAPAGVEPTAVACGGGDDCR